MMMSFRSGRSGSSCLRYPRRKSMFRLLSCASSMIMTPYCLSLGSFLVSARSTPSVMNLMRVSFLLVLSWNLILYPTRRLFSCNSVATRADTEVAATRRGWVQPMRKRSSGKDSRQNLGSWVVFPEPVSPETTMT